MSDGPTPEDAVAIAQRALGKVLDLEGEVAELTEEVTELRLLTSEWTDQDYHKLDKDTKIGMVREHAYTKARDGQGRALTYDDVMWEVFDGKPSADHCYDLMEAAGQIRGFKYRKNTRPKKLVCNPDQAELSAAFSSANKTDTEGGRV